MCIADYVLSVILNFSLRLSRVWPKALARIKHRLSGRSNQEYMRSIQRFIAYRGKSRGQLTSRVQQPIESLKYATSNIWPTTVSRCGNSGLSGTSQSQSVWFSIQDVVRPITHHWRRTTMFVLFACLLNLEKRRELGVALRQLRSRIFVFNWWCTAFPI